MSRHQKHGSNRGQRVAQQLHQEVAEMIRSEVKDPGIGMVTVTGVDLTPDYAYLTVHFSVLPDDDQSVADTLAGLKRASSYLRGRVGRRVRIHTTPEIRFVHDLSTTTGMAMSKLIDGAIAQSGDADSHSDASADATKDIGSGS